MNGPGNLIKDALRRKGRSQSELAKHVGVGRQAVSKWVRDGAIGPENLVAVANYLGLDPLALMGAQSGLKPSSDYLTPEAQAVARRFQSLPSEHQSHIRWLVDSLAALSSPRYRDFERELEEIVTRREPRVQKRPVRAR